jgi:hypothetical protein
MKTTTSLWKTNHTAGAVGSWPAWLKAGCLAIMASLCLALPVQAQTTITQNNLIQNGGLDSGSSHWGFSGGGVYWYPNGGSGVPTGTSYVSMGWWDGSNIYQNTGATFQPGIDYVLTIQASVGTSPMTGVRLSLQDVSLGWANVTNTSFTFPDQSTTWRIFSMYISSNTVASNVGDTIAVGGGILENPNTQYGWLYIDWMQLAPAIPQFTAQPQNITNYAGAAASLSATAIGAVTNSTGIGSVLTYQWYLSPATLLPNATNATLSFAALNATNGGNYHVVATGPYGSNQSSNATLVVLPANPPIVVTPPQSQSAYIYQTVQFSVAVSGTPPFSYQWKSNTIAITGATNTTLTLNNISAASAGTYSVAITNQFGGVSTNATLTVITPTPGTYEAAAINLQPQVYLRFSDINNTNLVLNEGALGTPANGIAEGAYVATTGPLPPSYPNFEATNPAVQYDGADTDVVIPPLNLSTNTGNTVSMSAWIYCYGTQTAYSGILFERGGDASGLQVQVDINGNNILSYDWASGNRWQFSSGLVIPQYQWCFTALVITPTNATIYLQNGASMQTAVDTFAEGTCRFTGNTYVGWDHDANSATSQRRFNGLIDETTIFTRALSPTEVNTLYSAATGDPAGVVNSPAGLTNFTGQPFQLSVVASGAPPLSFQWYKNNALIPGATNASYSVASAVVTNSGNYYVYVQNTAGNTNSAVATVSILTSAPFFTALPQPATFWAGVPASLTGAANGSWPLNYQWYQNNVLLAGQTNASLYFADPEAGNAGNYVLRASNAYGQTNSPSVQLAVLDPAQSAQMLYSTNTTGTWTLRNNYQPIQGVWFQTGNKNRVVTHLGYFDSTGTGLETNHWVGIYQGPPGSGILLAQVQVPSGTTAPHLSGFRWAALSTPLTLLANTNYMLAASDNNWDLWPDAYLPTWNPAYVGVTDGSTRYPVYDSALVAWPHEPNTPITSWGLDLTYGAFNLGAFPFTMTGSSSSSQIHWTLGTLLSSTNVAGPYTPVPGATSPFTMPLTGTSQFYRIQY